MRADGAQPGGRRWAIAGIAVVVVGTVAVAATYTPLFGASEIRIHGAGTVPRDDILRIGGVREGSNVFHLDSSLVERALEGDPRILDATVTTSLPDRISIRIRRRLPVAVLGRPPTLVGADGVVIGPSDAGVGLPTLSSAGGGPPAGDRLAAAAAAAGVIRGDLRLAVDSVVVDPAGELEVRLRAGFTALLGEATELEAKAESLRALLEWAEDRGVTILSADLTVPGSPTAQLDRGGAELPVP